MSTPSNPTLRRRQLAAELQRIREDRGLTLDDIAEQVGWSQAKLSRMFSAQVGVKPRDLTALLDVLEVTDQQQRDELATVAKQAREKGWWHRFSDLLPSPYSLLIGLESEATAVRSFQASLVPGLLQTEDYAYEVVRALRVNARPSEIKKTVSVRITRQSVLTRSDEEPTKLWAILDEAVLRRIVGNQATMRLQLEHLVKMGQLPNVTIQVLPFGAGAHAGMTGPFVLLSFSPTTHHDVVYLAGRESDLYLEKETEIEDYTVVFDHLRAAALKPDDSLTLIARAAEELR